MDISGELTKRHRATDTIVIAALGSVGLWAGLKLLNLGASPDGDIPRYGIVLAVVMGSLLLAGVGAFIWQWWCCVTEYTFDGKVIAVRTYGKRALQTIDAKEVVRVAYSIGGVTGYRFKLADGRQFVFSLQLHNVQELAAMISLNLP